jgi:hypothetical protein
MRIKTYFSQGTVIYLDQEKEKRLDHPLKISLALF